MTYDKRLDGRKTADALREITAQVGVIKNADGSAYFKIGNTSCYAAVYGPRTMFPRFLQNPKQGVLRCHYNMMPFSGQGNRVRPGSNRRAKEISMITQKAISPVVDLSNYPNSVVDVFIELPQTDAGSRCAGICAAALALADAGIIMSEMVAAIAIGNVDGTIVADLDYQEEAYEDGHVADIPIAMLGNSKKITLLQMDGICSPEQLEEGLHMAAKALDKIFDIQKRALKNRGEVIQE